MSVYYSIDGAAPTFLGSNTGWSDAGHWIDSLDAQAYPLLTQFRAHGWVEPAGRLATELRACLRAESPDEDVAGVLRELLAGSDDAGEDGVLVISDGEAAPVTAGVTDAG